MSGVGQMSEMSFELIKVDRFGRNTVVPSALRVVAMGRLLTKRLPAALAIGSGGRGKGA